MRLIRVESSHAGYWTCDQEIWQDDCFSDTWIVPLYDIAAWSQLLLYCTFEMPCTVLKHIRINTDRLLFYLHPTWPSHVFIHKHIVTSRWYFADGLARNQHNMAQDVFHAKKHLLTNSPRGVFCFLFSSAAVWFGWERHHASVWSAASRHAFS